jgi:hypothetical protein
MRGTMSVVHTWFSLVLRKVARRSRSRGRKELRECLVSVSVSVSFFFFFGGGADAATRFAFLRKWLVVILVPRAFFIATLGTREGEESAFPARPMVLRSLSLSAFSPWWLKSAHLLPKLLVKTSSM